MNDEAKADKEHEAHDTAFVHTGCQGDLDQGWDAAVAWAQAEIAKWLMAHDLDCQSKPGIGCEPCVRENVAGEVERGDWKE